MALIRKGDTVSILSGKDKGKSGKVLQIWPGTQKALVERINLVKHFERRSQQNPSGGVVEREGALAISKLAILCPKCKKPSRIGWELGEGSKQRICRRCKGTIDAT